ncbi:MAG: hypothetical protein OHK003_13970 [Anaerolineales bacterium]
MNGNRTHQRSVKSTHQKNPTHKQIKNKTPTPMKIGIMLLGFAGEEAGAEYATGGGAAGVEE